MADPSNLKGSFIWYDQMSNDVPAAEAFYTKVAGWTLAPNALNDQPYTLLKAAGASIGGLMPIPPGTGVAPMWMGYIAVDDVAVYADKIKAAGGAVHRPPTEIPNVGTFAVAGDPTGAGFLLFKGNGAGPTTLDWTSKGQIGWRELHAGDGPKAFDFYSGLFGWAHEETMDMGSMGKYQLFTAPSGQPGGMMTKTPMTPVPTWVYYINVDAADAAAGRVTAAGGKVVNGPTEVPGGNWIVQALDPMGAVFGLVAPQL